MDERQNDNQIPNVIPAFYGGHGSEEHWGEAVMTRFPYDFQSARYNEYKKAVNSCELPDKLFMNLNRISGGSKYALYLILLSGVKYVLARYSLNDNIIIGMPVFKVNSSLQQPNSIVEVRTEFSYDMTFRDFLMRIKKTVSEADKNLESLFARSDNMLENCETTKLSTVVLMEDIHNKPDIEGFNIGILVCFALKDEKLDVSIEYNSNLYKEETIQQILRYLLAFYSCVTENTEIKLSDIEILSEEEKNKLLNEFNNNKTNYPKESTVQQLFEEQVRKNPNSLIVFKDYQLTYLELNKKVNKLARVIRKKGIKANDIVGILMDNSVDVLTAILAVIKAGGAYLPIDPKFPQDRIVSMLNDSGAKLLISNMEIIEGFNYIALHNTGLKGLAPIVTCPRPQIMDFDSIPLPDRTLVDYEKYHKYIGMGMSKNAIGILASRGCPYNCAYCHKIWPKKQVMRSAENIFNEVRMYYDVGIRRFIFIDDIFNLNIKISSRVFNMIIDSGMKIHILFPTGVRGDILTKDYIDLMVRAGVVNISLALETASPRLQKLIGKNLNLEKLKENITYLTEEYPHIVTELFSMHGFPSETTEEARATLEFIKDIKWIHFPYFHLLKIYPGTDMANLAVQYGISEEAIENSVDLAFHEIPETLPFEKSFTQECQQEFLKEYILMKKRLLQVLPFQMKVFTEDELVQKYNSYLPIEIKRFTDLLDFVGIKSEELGNTEFLSDDYGYVPDFNQAINNYFPEKKSNEDAFKILMLDLSQFFSSESDILYDVVEAPLGHMYLLSYLNEKFGSRINGKIAKSRIDFNSYDELKKLIEDFKPDVIGVRTLTFFRKFFHKTVSLIRQWGINVPIISGGPYASSDYTSALKDRNIDLVIIGEGEITLSEIIEKMMNNSKKMPDEEVLKEIKGVAFIGKDQKEKNGFYNRDIILLDHLNTEDYDNRDLECINSSNDLAYIMYTSGSTGKPKGIITSHYSVVRVVKDTNYIDISSDDRLLQLSNYAFDGSVFDIFGALLNGAGLVLAPKDTLRDIAEISRLIQDKGISVFFVTTALFNALAEVNIECLKGVRKVLFGGERVSLRHVRKAFDYLGKNRILHMYGPTESTVFATCHSVDSIDGKKTTIPIGKPISNTEIYIVDKERRLQPIGAPGEIYISGDALAKGYIKNSELTNERFVPNIFRKEGTMYKTGDIGRWLSDGSIEFIDRIDTQVKLRGFRIELGEIEQALLEHKAVREAVVILKEDSQLSRYLCAYVVLNEGVEAVELNNYLSKILPDYMIPKHIVILDTLPFNQNGKIDKKALLEIEIEVRGKEYKAPPTNEVEVRLIEIFEEVFGVNGIHMEQNFWDLGGSSIHTTLVAMKIQQEFEVSISLRDIYDKQSLRNLSELIHERIGKVTKVEEKLSNDKVIVLIKGAPNGTGSNVFFIHDGSGEIEGYFEFINMLPEEVNYWAIRAKKYEHYAPQNIRIEEIAEEYIIKIKEIQAAGPFYLAGWSLGGTIAFEIVRQLELKGEQIGLCALFDSSLINESLSEAVISFEKETEIGIINNILGLDTELADKFQCTDSIEQLWQYVIDYVESKNSQMDYINKMMSAIPQEIHTVLSNCSNNSVRECIYYINLVRSFAKAQYLFYKPSTKVKTDVYFFKAEGGHSRNEIIWNSYCEKPIKLSLLNGNHYSIFNKQNIRANSKVFSDIIVDSVI